MAQRRFHSCCQYGRYRRIHHLGVANATPAKHLGDPVIVDFWRGDRPVRGHQLCRVGRAYAALRRRVLFSLPHISSFSGIPLRLGVAYSWIYSLHSTFGHGNGCVFVRDIGCGCPLDCFGRYPGRFCHSLCSSQAKQPVPKPVYHPQAGHDGFPDPGLLLAPGRTECPQLGRQLVRGIEQRPLRSGTGLCGICLLGMECSGIHNRRSAQSRAQPASRPHRRCSVGQRFIYPFAIRLFAPGRSRCAQREDRSGANRGQFLVRLLRR